MLAGCTVTAVDQRNAGRLRSLADSPRSLSTSRTGLAQSPQVKRSYRIRSGLAMGWSSPTSTFFCRHSNGLLLLISEQLSALEPTLVLVESPKPTHLIPTTPTQLAKIGRRNLSPFHFPTRYGQKRHELQTNGTCLLRQKDPIGPVSRPDNIRDRQPSHLRAHGYNPTLTGLLHGLTPTTVRESCSSLFRKSVTGASETALR